MKKIRQEVLWFGEEMEFKLRENSLKGCLGLSCSYEYLISQLEEEIMELKEAMADEEKSYKHRKVIRECADIGNFAMMIANRARVGKLF